MELYLKKETLIPYTDNPIEESSFVIVGLGWDNSSSSLPGQRLAPSFIRKFFSGFSGFDPKTKKNIFTKLTDVGDIDFPHGDYKEMEKRVASTVQKMFERNSKITPIFLGGDHSITYATTKAIKDSGKDFVFVVFDAHPDCWKNYSNNLFHGDIVSSINEENISKKIIQIGVRDFTEDEFEYLKKNKKKIRVFEMEEIRKKGIKKTLANLKKELKGAKNVYLSIDIDALDPVYAIGTGCPVSNGFSLEELKQLLSALKGKNLVGVDINEVNPLIEANLTPFAAADILKEIITKN